MESTIKHVGILGMKWGRRKVSSSTSSSSDHQTASKLKSRRLNELSNDELKKLTTRLQLEKQYKDLTKTDLSGGQKFVADVLQGAGKQLASKYVANMGESAIKIITDLFKKG